MNVRKLMTGALLAVGLATIGAAHAQAQSVENYPGSSCVRWAGPTPVFNYSRLFNPGTEILYLDCPVGHDPAKTVNSGMVDVVDQNFSGDDFNRWHQVCAQLVGVSQAGSSVTARGTPWWCTTGARSASQTLGGVVALPFDQNAHYYWSVSIPPNFNGQQSGIARFYITDY